MKTTEAIGIRLKQKRIALGLTQREFAKRLKVTSVHVCNVERGHCGMTMDRFFKACRLLNIRPSALLAEIGR